MNNICLLPYNYIVLKSFSFELVALEQLNVLEKWLVTHGIGRL